jgi:branched-chain amino acid transport system substrate-binding protein
LNFGFVQWQDNGTRAIIWPKEMRTGKAILPPWVKK